MEKHTFTYTIVGFYIEAIFWEGGLATPNSTLNVYFWFINSMEFQTTDLPAQMCMHVCIVYWRKQGEGSNNCRNPVRI